MLNKLLINSMYKISQIVQSILGWLAMGASLLLGYIGDGAASFHIVIAVAIFDAILGIISSVKRGGFIFSYLAKETLIKLGVYLIVLFIVFMIEKTLPLNFIIATPLLSAVICSIELWSILAHVIIIKPDLAIAHLLRKHLEGEITRKLNLSSKDVEDALNKKDEIL